MEKIAEGLITNNGSTLLPKRLNLISGLIFALPFAFNFLKYLGQTFLIYKTGFIQQ
jgi:hypothetical protein